MKFELTTEDTATLLACLVAQTALARVAGDDNRDNQLIACSDRFSAQIVAGIVAENGLTDTTERFSDLLRVTIKDATPDGRSGAVVESFTTQRNMPTTISTHGLLSISVVVD